MAFSYGFFNAKNLDRTYTAENFCDYLGSIICNGIQDNYGNCFLMAANNSKLVIGSGKAWIDGHYFISDTTYTIDFSQYVDASLPRWVAVGICCDTGESYRKIAFDVIAGSAATYPVIPKFENTVTKTYLTLCAVKIAAGAASLSVTDYRNNEDYCGYVRCILGKCKVSEILDSLSDYNNTVTELNKKIETLQNRLTEVEDVTGSTGVVLVSAGQCGDNVFYAIYSDGTVKLTGSGAMYDYDSDDNSPFYDNQNVKTILISEKITSVGAYIFRYCDALETVSLPSSLTKINKMAFCPRSDSYIPPTTARGLMTLNLNNVIEIGDYAFYGTRLTALTVPESVATVGKYAFSRCINLETVRYAGSIVGEFMFVYCTSLSSVALAITVQEISSHCFNYCDNLDEITYEGTLENWAAIKKGTNWDGNTNDTGAIGLTRVICTDGHMEYDSDKKEWNEVSE